MSKKHKSKSKISKSDDKAEKSPDLSGENSVEFALGESTFTEDVLLEADTNEIIEASEGEIRDFELDSDLSDTELEDAVESELIETAESEDSVDVSGTELSAFTSAEVEDFEVLQPEEIASIVESLLFATDRPQSVASLKSAFQGTKVRSADIRSALEKLQMEYSNPLRGVTIEEVAGGYQVRTKPLNQKYLLRTVKSRPFRLSGPALEVLSIVAYKQPCTKSMVDEVRGVECGHLMRGLLDRGLIHFAGKSELPGRPMQYETTRKFLEIFGLRNINELPTLAEIDQLIPEGIGEAVEEKPKLADITGELSTEVGTTSYSEGEEELLDISSELKAIDTTSAFFEEEKKRQKEKRDAEKAQDIRERVTVGEVVDRKDLRWLEKYELSLLPPPTALTSENNVESEEDAEDGVKDDEKQEPSLA